MIPRRWTVIAAAGCALSAAAYAYWKLAIPIHRVAVRSELVMLGDLDGDHRWSAKDVEVAGAVVQRPFDPAEQQRVARLDLDRNGRIDPEDVQILQALVAAGGDPYAAYDAAPPGTFPRPRELYRYEPIDVYRPAPLWALPYPAASDSALRWLKELAVPRGTDTYADRLDAEIYSEAVRFDAAYRRREPTLAPIEREYAQGKLAAAEQLYNAGDKYALLLALIGLVEDAETLTSRGQGPVTLKLLRVRDDFRSILGSDVYADFAAGRKTVHDVLALVSNAIRDDLGMTYDLETLGPPRNYTHLQNYLQRSEWQYYKTSVREADFLALIDYAQHDARYLRAVARTTPKNRDPNVLNHNLGMVLLFREALRIEHGDKKKAVGLLDEAIRIPYGWIKSIPREALPRAVALENFLLPGNKEDGADKSRHWNVFGGICVYKSPEEALDLALRREAQDLREAKYTEAAMREFLRDMIADLDGMYHVLSVDPDLLSE